MGAGPIKIAILANASQARREFDSVESRGQKFGRAIHSGAKVAAVGLLAVGAAAVKAGQAAAEDEAAQSRLAQTLKTAAGASRTQIAATESWITAQGKALGVSDDQLRPALSKLAVATGDVGSAQKLAAIAMDVSAGSGKSLETVTAAMARAQNGSIGGLGRLGIATKDASGKTLTLAQVTQQMADKYRGAASKAADTTAGKQKKLTVQMGELQEQIGAKLLPVMAKLTNAGLKAVDWMSKNEGLTKALIGTFIGLAAGVIAVSGALKVVGAAKGLVGMVKGAVAAAKAIKAFGLAAKVAAGFQMILNAAMALNPIMLVVLAIVALVVIFVIAWKKSETFRNIVIGAWNAIKAAAIAVFNFLKGFISAVWNGIKAATSAIWNGIKTAISAVFNAIKTVITTYINVYKTIITTAWNAIKAVTSAVWNGIKAVVGAVVSAVVGVFRAQFALAKTIITTAWNAVKTATTTVWNGIKTAVTTGVGKVMDVVRGIKDKVTGVFSGAAGWLKDAGARIIDGLLGPLRAGVQKVKDVLGTITSKIPDWKGPAKKDAKLLTPAGISIIQSLMDGFDVQTPAMRKQLQGLSKDIARTPFSASGEVKMSAADAYKSREAARSSMFTGTLRLSAAQASQLQRGREMSIDIRAYEESVGR